jgi:hypothetical protein
MTRVSGRRLLIALLVWAVLFGISFAVLIVLARFARIALVRDHLGDASALLLLAGYVALLVGLLVGFGGVRGLRERLGFRFTSARDLALALGEHRPARRVLYLGGHQRCLLWWSRPGRSHPRRAFLFAGEACGGQ